MVALLAVVDASYAEDAADRLIGECGSLPQVFAASRSRLLRALGDRPQMLQLLAVTREAIQRSLAFTVAEAPILSNIDAVHEYLRFSMAFEVAEHFRVLYLGAKNNLIADEVIAWGTVDSVPVPVRMILTRALERGALALILVHNHPSGDPKPSRQDIQFTRAVVAAAKPLDICIHDHFIVGSAGMISLRVEGLF